MNPRTTALLLVVAAALGAFVYWVEIRGGEQRRAAEEAEKRLFPGVAAEDIRAIELTTMDGRSARIERTDDGWRLREPLDFPADPLAADTISSSLAELESAAVLEDAQDPEVYSLGEKARVLRFETDEGRYELRIGSKTPVGSETYVTAGEEKRIVTVETFRAASLTRSLEDLRERRPLRFDREAIERIEVRWPEGGVVLEKQDGAWKMVEPLETGADETTVENLLSDLNFLRATGFLDDPPPDEEVGLDAPIVNVALVGETPDGQAEPPRFEMRVGSVVLDEGLRAVRAGEGSLYKVSKTRLDAIPSTVVAYRFKDLSRFVTSDADRLEIVFQTDETVAITATRGEAGWTSEPEKLGAGKAASIVAELSDLRAQDIAAESMSEAELAEHELSPAVVVLRVSGGDERLAEVHLGQMDPGRGIYARVPDRPTVYLLPADEAEHLPVSLEAFRNRFLSKDESE